LPFLPEMRLKVKAKPPKATFTKRGRSTGLPAAGRL
jgi:hypothetical protein